MCVPKDANFTLFIHDLCFLAQIYASLVVMCSNSWVLDLLLLSNASNEYAAVLILQGALICSTLTVQLLAVVIPRSVGRMQQWKATTNCYNVSSNLEKTREKKIPLTEKKWSRYSSSDIDVQICL